MRGVDKTTAYRECLPSLCRRALSIANPKSSALVVSKINLAKVAAQVLLRDVVIDANQSALEQREMAFDGVGVSLTTNVFLDAVG